MEASVQLTDLVRRDSDLAFRARMLLAAAWALFAGAGLGVALGYLAVQRGGLTGGAGVVVGLLVTVLVTVSVTVIALAASGSVGDAAGRLLHPAAGRRRSDHSLPRALLAQGRLEEAVRAFEVAVATDPSDPDPYLELARLHRDRLGRPEDALRWYRRARDQSVLSAGEARLLMREIVELGRKHLHSAALVAPDLARHLAAHEGTAEGSWALAELAEIKRGIVS